MSVQVFFAFSLGLNAPITAPRGTLAALRAHVADVEEKLGLEATSFNGNPAHWDLHRANFKDIEDELLCTTALEHNDWVRRLYADISRWAAAPPADGETITPEEAQTFWRGLQQISVPVERWTRDFYRSRMEHAFEVMRGREDEGVTWRGRKLTAEQAGAVIWLFGMWLDHDDIRLEVPRGHDHLASSYNGEYEWCERCGAVTYEDGGDCRRKGCPVRARLADEDA